MRERKGFRNIVEHLHLEGGAHVFERWVAGDDDDAQAWISCQQLFQHLVALEFAHLHVEQNDVGQALFTAGEQFIGMAERADGIQSIVLQCVLEVITKIEIVVQNGKIHQAVDRGRIGRAFRRRLYCQCVPPVRREPEAGNVTSRQAPPSRRFDAAMVPPCWCTMPSATVRPSPVPLASNRVDTKASKMSGSTSAAMPGPLSSTVTEIHGCALRFKCLEWTAISPEDGMAYSALRSRLTNTCTRRSELPVTTSFAST